VKPHAGAAQAERLAVRLGIADDPDLGMVGQIELRRHHDVQRTQAAGEGDMVVRRHVEVAEHQKPMTEPSRLDRGQCRVIDT